MIKCLQLSANLRSTPSTYTVISSSKRVFNFLFLARKSGINVCGKDRVPVASVTVLLYQK